LAVILNLKEELKEEPFIEKDYSIPFKDLNLPEEYSFDKENVDVHLYVIKDDKDYVISLNLKSDIKLQCGRCLENYIMDIDTSSDIILSHKDIHDHNELSEEDLIVEYLEDEENFNLNNLIREEIIVQTPMKPLCDENCKGICPICGADKNKEGCDCETKLKREDSPFSVLKSILDKNK
jgi:uncharacterized protein